MTFLHGVNLPWLDYGLDFGANAWQPEGGLAAPGRRARLETVFARLASRGWRVVRWFLLCDGRAGVRFASDGAPQGLDDRVLADADVAVALARAHRLELLFTLIDFMWFARARAVRGVKLGGHARTVAIPRQRERLLDRVFAPILERYGQDATVWGWDLCNEPEWATRRLRVRRRSSVSRAVMRAFLGDALVRAHALVRQPVTVGLASVRGLGLVTGLGLDLYQAHWYDSIEGRAPLDAPVAALGLDRPLLLGEFPTRGSRRTPAEITASARRAGWAGAFAWSVLAQDAASDFSAVERHRHRPAGTRPRRARSS